MGGEQVVHPTAGQRVDYKERRGRRVSLSGIVWDFFRYAGDFDERRSECVGPAADVRAKIVSSILARAADRHLYDHGSKRRQDKHEYRADDAETAIAVAIAASEEHGKLRKHGNGASGYRHCQRVVITHMA